MTKKYKIRSDTKYTYPMISNCCYCGVEFKTTRNQRASFNKGQTNLFCSRDCYYKNKVGSRSKGKGNTKYSVDEDYFYHIDTEDKAYWLGFIAADGCVMLDGQFCLSITSIDLDHLEKLRDSVSYNGPIRSDKRIIKRGVGNPHYVLRINNRNFVENLTKHGIKPRKTFTLTYPWFLPKNLVRHYIRGYLDGDGCIYNKGNYVALHMIGTYNLMLGIAEFLQKEGLISSTRLHKHKTSNVFIFERSYKQGRQVLDYIYKDASIYMTRKYEKYKLLRYKDVVDYKPVYHGCSQIRTQQVPDPDLIQMEHIYE